MSIDGTFDLRTFANMHVALDRVCEKAADGEDHSVRERVARQIIRCARGGHTTLRDLTAAGQQGLIDFSRARKQIDQRIEPAVNPSET